MTVIISLKPTTLIYLILTEFEKCIRSNILHIFFNHADTKYNNFLYKLHLLVYFLLKYVYTNYGVSFKASSNYCFPQIVPRWFFHYKFKITTYETFKYIQVYPLSNLRVSIKCQIQWVSCETDQFGPLSNSENSDTNTAQKSFTVFKNVYLGSCFHFLKVCFRS